MKTFTYTTEEIFPNVEDRSEDVLMNIPPEIAEEMGWKPGDQLKIVVLESGGISISKVEDEQ